MGCPVQDKGQLPMLEGEAAEQKNLGSNPRPTMLNCVTVAHGSPVILISGCRLG